MNAALECLKHKYRFSKRDSLIYRQMGQIAVVWQFLLLHVHNNVMKEILKIYETYAFRLQLYRSPCTK